MAGYLVAGVLHVVWVGLQHAVVATVVSFQFAQPLLSVATYATPEVPFEGTSYLLEDCLGN